MQVINRKGEFENIKFDKITNRISKLNDELDKFQKIVEENNDLYESMLDKTTESLEKILSNTGSTSKVQ